MRPKVSVIIPVYGVEKYIERCARSLFSQTLDSIEYIFIDDCSPDTSIQILKKTLEDFPDREGQVKIIAMPENSGQAAVRIQGIKFAAGEYVIHCDSDDWVDVTMYEDLYNEAVLNKSDIVMCDYYISKSPDDDSHVMQDVDTRPSELMHGLLMEKVHGSVWNKLVKRELYDNDIIYPEHNLREDLALMIQLVYYANSIGYISKPYYHYFCNPESITQKSLSMEKSLDRGMQAIHNCQLMSVFLSRQACLHTYRSELMSMMLRLKNNVASLTGTKEGRQKWGQLLPELTMFEALSSEASLREKCVYLLAYFRLYNVLKRILMR